MEISGELVFKIGFLFWMIPFCLILLGKFRNPNVIWGLFIISLLFSIYGIYIFDNGITFGNNKNAAGILFGPLVYILLNALMRHGFIKAYGFEPDIPHYSKYSRIDNRKLNLFDVLVFFIPTFVSVLVATLLSN